MVCEKCSKFGKVLTIERPPMRFGNPKPTNYRPPVTDEMELVPNFRDIIRRMMKVKGWDLEKLAAELYEKRSVIAHVESGQLEPEAKLVAKIERVLGVKLRVLPGEEERPMTSSGKGEVLTLEDIVVVKKKK